MCRKDQIKARVKAGQGRADIWPLAHTVAVCEIPRAQTVPFLQTHRLQPCACTLGLAELTSYSLPGQALQSATLCLLGSPL